MYHGSSTKKYSKRSVYGKQTKEKYSNQSNVYIVRNLIAFRVLGLYRKIDRF